MQHDPTETRLREILQRRALTAAEEADLVAWLATHPEAQARWQEERALSALITRLPHAPVPTNFTARVLQQIELETRRETRNAVRPANWWLRIFLPRTAVAAVLIGAGLLTHQSVKTRQLANTIAVVAPGEEVLTPEVLSNFETISRLGPGAQPDMELLAAMQ